MPAPSLMTKPSRSLSKGRLAFSGSSFRVESAFMDVNPATARGVMTASVPRDHRFGVAVFDESEGVADGVASGGASRADGGIGAPEPVPNGHHAGGHVDYYAGNEKGRNAAGALVLKGLAFLLDHRQAADAGADDDSDAVQVPFGGFQTRVGQSHLRPGQGVLDEQVESPGFLPLHVGGRIEVLHLTADFHPEVRRIKTPGGADSASPGQNGVPVLPGPDSQRGQKTDAREDNPSFHLKVPLSGFICCWLRCSQQRF